MLVKPTIQQTIEVSGLSGFAEPGALPWERRADDALATFTAPDIANLMGHWTGESVVLTSSRVSQATDLSGQANHLTQATSTQRPIVIARSAGGALRDAIQFRTANVEWLRDTAFAAAFGNPATVYVLHELAVASPATSIVYDDGGTSEVAFFYSGGFWRAASGNTLASTDGTKTGVRATCFVTGATGALYLDDFTTSVASGNFGTNQMGSLTLGANTAGAGPIDGYVWRVLVYSGAHSQATRNLVRDQINEYYGTSVV